MTSPSSAADAEWAAGLRASGQLVVRLDGTRVHPPSLVGDKAHGLSKIRAAGLPTPPAFTVTVDACRQYFNDPDTLMARLWPQIGDGLAWLEEQSGRTFGGGPVPLLVAVRSGAPASMPGMMDTVLNLGINRRIEQILAQTMGVPFARDTHHRFKELFRRVVAPDARRIPPDPRAQLRAAVSAVFGSWNSVRAVSYRRHHNLEGTVAGTAVTVQAMVFGNLDDRSGTGVVFSRNPLTGERRPYGEWLPHAQGEDVVSGKVDPLPLEALAAQQGDVHRQLLAAASRLEAAGTDMQDIEFTVEAGKLYLLQTRVAKRSAKAAVAVAVALHREGLIDADEALARVTPAQVDVLLTPVIEEAAVSKATIVATGVPASPGVGAGVVVADSKAAEDAAESGEPVVLARDTTSPDDVGGMISASAVITEQGGSTSHAAVVSRELHRACVVGCGKGSLRGLAGSEVTVDGAGGIVYAGRLPLTNPSEDTDSDMATLLAWARARSPVKVLDAVAAADLHGVHQVDHRDPATVYAALAAGAGVLSADHPLPVLLVILGRRR